MRITHLPTICIIAALFISASPTRAEPPSLPDYIRIAIEDDPQLHATYLWFFTDDSTAAPRTQADLDAFTHTLAQLELHSIWNAIRISSHDRATLTQIDLDACTMAIDTGQPLDPLNDLLFPDHPAGNRFITVAIGPQVNRLHSYPYLVEYQQLYTQYDSLNLNVCVFQHDKTSAGRRQWVAVNDELQSLGWFEKNLRNDRLPSR